MIITRIYRLSLLFLKALKTDLPYTSLANHHFSNALPTKLATDMKKPYGGLLIKNSGPFLK